MLIIFWISTFLLYVAALAFVLPWIRSTTLKVLIFAILFCGAYGHYWVQGSSPYLAAYYSSEEQLQREKRGEFRVLLSEFRKEEFRLKLRLEENSADQDAEWRLCDLLAIKALYNRDQKLAVQYWDKAIRLMPEHLRDEWKVKKANLEAGNASIF